MVEMGAGPLPKAASEADSADSADRFVAPAARMDANEAEAVLREVFGVEGQVEPLTSERDLNFRVRAGGGGQFVLKIAHVAEPEPVLAFQTAALRRLEAEDASLPVPRVVATRSGADYARVNGCITRLLTWLDGPLMHQRPRTAEMRRSLGDVHARLDRALAGMEAPPASEPLLWDLQHMAALEHLLAHIPSDRRDIVACAMDRFKARVAPALASLPTQVIHNDLNPHNVVVSDDGEAVAGVIDFGDMVYAPRACDVAVAAAYHVRSDADPFRDVSEYVAAYHNVLPLAAQERDVLTDMIVSRLAMTALITTWRAGLHPDNSAYILRNAPAAWAGLEAIVPGDRRLEIG